MHYPFLDNDHKGLYGGSFVAGKYESSDDQGHQGSQGGLGNHYTSIAGYGDSKEYSALLAASDSSGHSVYEGAYSHWIEPLLFFFCKYLVE